MDVTVDTTPYEHEGPVAAEVPVLQPVNATVNAFISDSKGKDPITPWGGNEVSEDLLQIQTSLDRPPIQHEDEERFKYKGRLFVPRQTLNTENVDVSIPQEPPRNGFVMPPKPAPWTRLDRRDSGMSPSATEFKPNGFGSSAALSDWDAESPGVETKPLIQDPIFQIRQATGKRSMAIPIVKPPSPPLTVVAAPKPEIPNSFESSKGEEEDDGWGDRVAVTADPSEESSQDEGEEDKDEEDANEDEWDDDAPETAETLERENSWVDRPRPLELPAERSQERGVGEAKRGVGESEQDLEKESVGGEESDDEDGSEEEDEDDDEGSDQEEEPKSILDIAVETKSERAPSQSSLAKREESHKVPSLGSGNRAYARIEDENRLFYDDDDDIPAAFVTKQPQDIIMEKGNENTNRQLEEQLVSVLDIEPTWKESPPPPPKSAIERLKELIVPVDTVPVDIVPVDTAPADIVPVDIAPVDIGPVNIVPVEEAPQNPPATETTVDESDHTDSKPKVSDSGPNQVEDTQNEEAAAANPKLNPEVPSWETPSWDTPSWDNPVGDYNTNWESWGANSNVPSYEDQWNATSYIPVPPDRDSEWAPKQVQPDPEPPSRPASIRAPSETRKQSPWVTVVKQPPKPSKPPVPQPEPPKKGKGIVIKNPNGQPISFPPPSGAGTSRQPRTLPAGNLKPLTNIPVYFLPPINSVNAQEEKVSLGNQTPIWKMARLYGRTFKIKKMENISEDSPTLVFDLYVKKTKEGATSIYRFPGDKRLIDCGLEKTFWVRVDYTGARGSTQSTATSSRS
ncbi:hypothetical protein ABW19_dt0204854 [Dactylella cylindrospora]|nr:hypothetical protein ABW19_dt0204854 [Dactylella cylindrospora]